MKRASLSLVLCLLVGSCFQSEIVCDMALPPPLLSIQSAKSDTNLAIKELSLSNFSYQGADAAVSDLFPFDLTSAWLDANTAFTGNIIVCSVPCLFGFNANEGMYSFDVTADGYETVRETVNASYEQLPPSQCGNSRGNKVKLNITLQAKL